MKDNRLFPLAKENDRKIKKLSDRFHKNNPKFPKGFKLFKKGKPL